MPMTLRHKEAVMEPTSSRTLCGLDCEREDEDDDAVFVCMP